MKGIRRQFALSPTAFDSFLDSLLWRNVERIGSRMDNFMDSSSYHKLDEVMCSIRGTGGLFNKGWGDPSVPIAIHDEIQRLKKDVELGIFNIPSLEVELSSPQMLSNGIILQDGRFPTPTTTMASDLLPKESKFGYFQIVKPSQSVATLTNRETPLVLLLPGTGESGFQRRRLALSLPLAQMGISSCILEGPFYGKRRPPRQLGTKLEKVSDLPILGRVTIEEARGLLNWLSTIGGFKGAKVVAGASMGGLHSAMTASLLNENIGVVSWVGPHSGVPVFTKGVMSRMINWKKLYQDGNEKEIEKYLERVKWEIDKLTDLTEEEEIKAKAKKYMQQFLAVTDLTHVGPPRRPDAAIFSVALDDAYIPYSLCKDRWIDLKQGLWSGSQLLQMSGGHVSSILFRRQDFRNAIIDSINKLEAK